MKNIFLTVIAILFVSLPAFSQLADKPTGKKHKHQKENNTPCPKVYFGVSTGINNPNGILGFNFDLPIVKFVSLDAGVGVSSWGNKVYLEGRYYLRPCQRGLAFAGGLTHNSGVSNFERKFETINGRQDITINLHEQTNLYLAVYRFWNIGRRHNRFYLDAGYSVPLKDVSYKQVSGPPLSSEGKDEVKRIAPGGLILGAGFSFGIQ